MKRLSFLTLTLMALLGMHSAVFAQYSVTITPTDCWWISQESYKVWESATIKHNGSPIANSQNYYYSWYEYLSQNGGYVLYESGCGSDTFASADEYYTGSIEGIYVVVTDTVNHTFTDITSTVDGPYTMPSKGQDALWRPIDQSGTDLSGTPNHWRWTIDKWKSGYANILTTNHQETLQATPDYISPLGQKVQYWFGDKTNILNYNTFQMGAVVESLKVQYWSVDSTATITTSVIDDGSVSGGSVSLKDPWFVDQAGLGGVKRNEGMSAPFISRQAPFHPDLSTSYSGNVYDGVFLGVSGPNNGWAAPYYSVSAPMVQSINGYTAFFVGWTSSPSGSASFEYPSQATTPVEFISSGATVIAQYKYYTVTYNTTMPSGTWPMAGSVTIPSGVTLTGSSGATMKFPSGATLVANGSVNGNGLILSATSGT